MREAIIRRSVVLPVRAFMLLLKFGLRRILAFIDLGKRPEFSSRKASKFFLRVPQNRFRNIKKQELLLVKGIGVI